MDQKEQPVGEHLLLQYLQGQADQVLSAEIERWLEADTGNRETLDRLESLWVEAGKLTPAPVAVDVDAAWKKISLRIDHSEKSEGRRSVQGSRFSISHPIWYAAASVLLLTGIFGIYRLLTVNETCKIASLGIAITDTLPDGSRINLNVHSTLTFDENFDRDSRRVKLSGEAFFYTAHDSAIPFIVETKTGSVMVVGTAFLVSARPGSNLSVEVKEGKVRLFTVKPEANDTLSVFLEQGERGRVLKGIPEKVAPVTSSPDELFWADQALDFRNTPLSEVINTLEKHYSVKIKTTNAAMLNCRLTATFAGEDIDHIITVIAASFGFRFNKKGNIFSLEGAGCTLDENP